MPENDNESFEKPVTDNQPGEFRPEEYLEEAMERAALVTPESASEETRVEPANENEVVDESVDLSAQDDDAESVDEAVDAPLSPESSIDDVEDTVPGANGESDPDLPGDESDHGEKERAGKPRAKARTVKSLPRREVTLVVNDEPGEECRIAVLADGRLDSYFSEREASATNVGSIYKGRVMNIEAAIQAAFVDFGSGQNGFLHISDLHPKYFPGQERTEQVGKKIARSDRPLIQQALRKGQEILVQVIKEGLGSKGPTLTSYLSLPGRLLVMMPDMDRVGVSRRVEDEDQRREMRKILDSLELPEGFGFILRTAGFDSTKTELQRDAAYLQRLWDAMEARSAKTGAPCELYTESDVLVRTLRDHTDSSVASIIVDTPSSFERAKMFLDVIAPNSSAKVSYYNGNAPVFDAFGIEKQIDEIHSRTVPLPSGGALVFDQTEALVAVDVNSGRSRAARDSETNAFQTNCEAIDELCRQLRLRDLGGLIVVDCIDMRISKNRREVEDRLTALLRLDRAKSSFAPISEFGIIEMTRQRMRPSLRKMHYSDCPHCSGSGEIRLPDAVAADAMRRVSLLFCHESIHRVEMVCSVRVAGEMMSKRRRAMHELEERLGKRIDIRISEAFAADRVEMYAYDDRNSDIELDRLPALPQPSSKTLHDDLPEEEEAELSPAEVLARRRRRKRRPAPADATAIALAGGFENLPEIVPGERTVRESFTQIGADDEDAPRSRDRSDSRRRGRGRRDERKDSPGQAKSANQPQPRAQSTQSASAEGGSRSGGRRRGRGRGRGRRSIDSINMMAADGSAFETTKVANVVNTSVEELVQRLKEQCDAETAALLTPATFMLPPELIQKVKQLYPQSDDDSTQENESAQEHESSDGSADQTASTSDDQQSATQGESRGRNSRRRRGGRGRSRRGEQGGANNGAANSTRETPPPVSDSPSAPPAPAAVAPMAPAPVAPPPAPVSEQPVEAPKPKRRSLYGAAVRLLSSVERSKAKSRKE